MAVGYTSGSSPVHGTLKVRTDGIALGQRRRDPKKSVILEIEGGNFALEIDGPSGLADLLQAAAAEVE